METELLPILFLALLAGLTAQGLLPFKAGKSKAVRFGLFAVEALAIVAIIYSFLDPVLDFDELRAPNGYEWENNTGLIALARDSILNHFEFPLWNPYIKTGIPYMGDPFVHLLNPLASVPALFIGAVNGPKLTMVLTLFASAFGMYYFATVLGLRGPARLWAAILFGINGHMMGRFAIGHYDLAISFPLIPLSFAFLLQAMRGSNRLYAVAAGLSNAVLFFSGNVYYVLYAIPGLLVVGLFALAEQVKTADGWRFSRALGGIGRAAEVGVWTLGFSAIQLFPYIDVQEFVFKDSDPNLAGSPTVLGSILSLFRSDPEFLNEESYGRLPRMMNEYYSYIGVASLAGLVGLPLAWIKRRWTISLIALLFLLYLGLASARHTPFTLLYQQFDWLYNFRGTQRGLAFVVPFAILLSAFGFDAILQLASKVPSIPVGKLMPFSWAASHVHPSIGRLQVASGAFAAIVIGGGFLYGLNDPFQDNQDRIGTNFRRTDHIMEADWFRRQEPGAFYVSLGNDGSGGLSADFYEKGIQRVDTPWGWTPALRYPDDLDRIFRSNVIVPRPKYLVLHGNVVPEEPDAKLLYQEHDFRFYLLEDSPPFASLIRSSDPPLGADVPWEHTREVSAEIVSSNVIEARADSDGSLDTLLLVESYFPGWRVEVDGKDTGEPVNLTGFVSFPAQEGEHVYRFIYDPKMFRSGAWITVGTILAALLVVLDEAGLLRLRRRKAAEAAAGAEERDAVEIDATEAGTRR